MVDLTDGQKLIQEYQDAGYSDADIAAMRQEKTKAAVAAGYSQKELDEFWGDNQPKSPTLGNVIKDNLAQQKFDPNTLDTADPDSWMEMFQTGFDWSSGSLMAGRVPGKIMPEESGIMAKIMAATGQIVGDAPAMIAGAIGGGVIVGGAGAEAGATRGPAGALAGGSFGIGAGAGFGGAALPTLIREVILDDMINGKFSSWDDVMERSWGILKETAVEGTVGALTGVAGRKAFLVTQNTSRVTMRAAEVTTMAATGATTSGLFHGRVPTAEDFILGVALTGMIPVGGKFAGDLYRLVGARQRAELTDTGEAIAARMQEMWAKTGIDPKEQGRAAGSDPAARQAILGADADGQVVTSPFEDMRAPEPPKKSATVEIDGGMQKPTFGKKAEGEAPVEFKPLERTGEVSEVTGIAPVKNINVEQFAQIVNEATPDIVDALYPDRTVREQQMGERLTEITGKYKNPDGSFDLEAGLIEFYESGDKAMLFRANGRKHGALHPNTQRALEKAGFLLDRDGYKPLVPEAGKGSGGGMRPPPPKGPGSEVGPVGAPKKAGEEPHFPRDKEFVNEDIDEVYGSSTEGQTWGDYYRQNKGDWRELAILGELDKRFKLRKTESDIGLEDMFRLTLSSAGRAKVRKEVGGYRITVDKDGNPMYELNDKVPALNQVWKGAEKGPLKVEGGVKQLRNYLQALDTMDRVKLGLKTSVKPELAQELLAALPKAELKKLEALADMHRKVFNDTLEGAVQHHILSRKAADTIMERHPNWFPQIVAEGESGYLTGAIRGVKSAIKRAKGHEYTIKDPILETLHAMDQRERLGSANLARRSLVMVLREQGLIDGDFKVNRLKIEGPAKGDVLDEHGNIIKGVEKKFFEHNPNEVVYYENGMRREVRIKDFPGRQEIMRLLEGPSVFDKNLGISLLTTAARIKRMAIVELPDFLLRAMMMDSVNVAIMSKDGGLPVHNTLSGAFDAIDYATKGKLGGEGYKKRVEYLLNGGYDMTLADMNADHTLESYHVMTSPGHIARVLNSVKHPLEAVQTIFRMTDAFTRMGGVYTHARGRIGPIRAAMESRRASLDFGERSLSPVVNLLASLTPFFAPSMRGLDSFQYMLKKDPMGVAMRGAVLTTAAVTLTAYNYYFDEMMGDDIPESARYENINRKEKDTFFHIPFVNPMDGQVTRLRLPLPFGLGPVFAGFVPRMFDKMKTEDPRAFKGYRDSIASKFLGGLVPLAGNPLIQPWMEALANYDFHSGKPWIPARMENLSGPNQYYPWTSEVSKNVAAMVSQAGYDLSPLTFDKFLNAWTGQLGPNILRITDGTFKDNPMPRDIANTPFMGSFFLRNPGVSAQPINDFYDEYEAYKKAAGDVTFLESGEKEDTPEYEKAVAALEKFDGTDMALVAQALTEQRKVMYEMYEDETMDANDKRQILDEVASQMIETTRMALQELDEARKDAEEDGS